MENKNIEFSVDPREYQMALIMTLPKNTPKAAMKVIRELQKERDFLLEQNEKLKDTIDRDSGCEENARLRKENEKLKKEHEKLKEDQLTEENAMDYIYQHSDKYEDWIQGSDLYKELKEENEKLKEDNEELKEELDVWVNPTGEAVMNGEGMMLYEASQEENEKLKKENEKLKKEHEHLKLLAEPMFRAILNHENN